MATYSKPAKVPNWADVTANILEPPEAYKTLGWVLGVEPPSNFENYRTNLNGNWWRWISERWTDGASADEIVLLDPSGSNADPLFTVSAGPLNPSTQIVFEDAGLFSSLRFQKDDQSMKWLSTAGAQEFEARPGRVVAGRGDVDGINLIGIGVLKEITFDSPLNRMTYDITGDVWSVFCNSASPSLVVDPTKVECFVGGVQSAIIDNEGVQAPIFSPTNTSTAVKDRFDVAQRNQVCLSVKVDVAGIVSGRPWNLSSVVNLSTGDWEVFATEQCTDDTIPVASVNELTSLHHANATYDNATDSFRVKTFNRSNGNDADAAFTLIGLGG